ncbi:MAG: hypothetical protein P8J89_01210 [Phycisphaerales bacterium]|nr:hypothetical protein [Phycisphaerales bacterium]
MKINMAARTPIIPPWLAIPPWLMANRAHQGGTTWPSMFLAASVKSDGS